MKRFHSIDGMKTIAAFLVICIHIPFPGLLGEIITPIARIAVPFFFMVSGFLLWSDIRNILQEKVISSIKNILWLIVVANLLYFVWRLILVILPNQSVSGYLINIFSLKNIIKFLIFNDSPLSGHLWYLSAYFYVLVIYFFINRFDLLNVSYRFIPFLLIVDLILGKYSIVLLGIELPIIIVRNFLFVGLPYFLIGNFIRQKYELGVNPFKDSHLSIIGIFIFSFTTLIEKYILEMNMMNATRDHYISTTPLVIFILIYLLKNQNLFKGTWMEKTGAGSNTLYIYILHPIIITVYKAVSSRLPNTISFLLQLLGPIFVYIISNFVSVLYIKFMSVVVECRGARKIT